jgi:UDP-N-acetylglucosamine acyltransferase
MNSIHPTAIVGPGVQLGRGNVIGPYAVLGGLLVLGDDNWIGAGAKIGAPPEVRSFEHPADWVTDYSGPGVIIGSGNVLREEVQVHGGWKSPTRLADDTFVMNRAYIAHDCVVENGVTFASGSTIGGHVKIGHGANLGLNSTVHQRRVIGALAMIGMGSVVTRDVPPYAKAFGNPCRVQGLNAVGLGRAGVGQEQINGLEEVLSRTGIIDESVVSEPLIEDFAWYRRGIAS